LTLRPCVVLDLTLNGDASADLDLDLDVDVWRAADPVRVPSSLLAA
jgi:hypothetical protein